mgnify:CR=1 FL=1
MRKFKLLAIVLALSTMFMTACKTDEETKEEEKSLPIKVFTSRPNKSTDEADTFEEHDTSEDDTSSDTSSKTKSDSTAESNPNSRTSATTSKTEVNEPVTKKDRTTEYQMLVPLVKETDIGDYPLGRISMNGKRLDIANCTVSDFLELSGMKFVFKGEKEGKATDEDTSFDFYGRSFGHTDDSTPIYVEAVQAGKLVKDEAWLDEESFDKYEIKGIYFSNEDILVKRDKGMIWFGIDIHLGSLKENIVGTLGKGHEVGNATFYKNDYVTLILIYKEDTTAKKLVVDEVYLLRNK